MTSPSRWALTQEAFEGLLERLGPDRDSAAQAYEALRARLLDYFDWNGTERPDVAADETVDRVARRLAEGERIEQIAAFAHGVAKLVLLEHQRSRSREQRAAAAVRYEAAPWLREQDPSRLECLVRCLGELPADARGLIVAYYEGAGRSHLEGRKRLAVRLGIPYATLKTRAHRMRIRLEACLRDCLMVEAGNR